MAVLWINRITKRGGPQMKKRLISIAICFVMVMGLITGMAMPVFAEEEIDEGNVKLDGTDSFNLDDFEYTVHKVDGIPQYVTLKSYKGNAENLIIPKKTSYGGRDISVELNNYCGFFFNGNDTLRTVDFELSTNNVTDMYRMFSYCTKLESVTGLETGNVTTMNSMFQRCTGMKTFNPTFDTRKVQNMEHMFDECTGLTSLDLSGFDTSSVTTTSYMFDGCENLTSINMTGWNTRNVENMQNMFGGCKNLQSVDVSHFDTRNVEYFNNMFEGCNSLKILDLSKWDMRNGYSVGNYVFDGCDSLQEIKTPLNLKSKVNLPCEFYQKDMPTIKYTTLPENTETSYTLLRTEKVIMMYRLYNPNSGEHFYTREESERDNLVSKGWDYEGIAWKSPILSKSPVYRLYNPNTGDHHYTRNYSEKDMLVTKGWSYEGIGWYSAESGEALHRLYNPNAQGAGSHHYTVSEGERNHLESIGWTYEGIGWYGL